MKQYSKIIAYPVLYLKNTNGDYVLDTNNEKIVLQDFNTVSPISDYDVITEYFTKFYSLEVGEPEEPSEIWVASTVATDPSVSFAVSRISPENIGNVNYYTFVKPMINVFDCISDGGYENSSAIDFITGATGCLTRFPSTISKLLELPEGKRSIYLRRYNQGPILENTQDRYPSGGQIPWAENDITLLTNDWSIIANAMKSNNAVPDYIIGDMEQNPFGFFTVGGNTTHLNEITGDSRISQPWYSDASFQNYYTFNDQFPLSYTEIYSNTYHPQLNTQYLRWDSATKGLFNALINESLYKTSKTIFGNNIKFSNYDSKYVNIENYYYGPDGHPTYRQTLIGDGMSPTLYAAWRFPLVYGIYNQDPTRIVRTDFGATTEFPANAWNQLLLLINNIRSVKRSAPNIPLRPYIASINFTGDAAYNPKWKDDAASEGLYWESIRHFSLTGSEMFITWNEPDNTTEMLQSYLTKLNDTIEDINTRLIGYSNVVGNTTQINFLTNYIISGAKIVNSDNYLWRVTPKPGVTLLNQSSNIVTVDSDGGAWVVTNNSTIPTFTLNTIPWTPQLLGSSVSVWVDANDYSTITASGAPLRVSEWRDKSANTRHLSQGTSNFRPYYLSSGIGGKPAIQFLNANSTFIRNAFGLIPQPYTIAIIFRTPAQGNISQSGMIVSSANTQDGGVDASGTTINTFSNSPPNNFQINQFAGSGGGAAQGNVVGDSNYIHVGQFNGGSSQYSTNGINSTVNSGARSLSGLELGAWNNGGNKANITIGEVVVVNRLLTQTERELFEGYFAWKWEMQASLPINHPYKNTAPTVNA
jgi:hypothetical protein